MTFSAMLLRSELFLPWIRKGSSMASAAEKRGLMEVHCILEDHLDARPDEGQVAAAELCNVPPTSQIVLRLGSRRVTQRATVDFPEPEAPTRPVFFPYQSQNQFRSRPPCGSVGASVAGKVSLG